MWRRQQAASGLPCCWIAAQLPDAGVKAAIAAAFSHPAAQARVVITPGQGNAEGREDPLKAALITPTTG